MMRSYELRNLKSQTARSHQFFKDPGCWSGWGLNPRLPAWQTSTLTTELTRWSSCISHLQFHKQLLPMTSANLCLNEVHDRVFYLSPLSRMLSLSIKSSLLFFPLLGVTLRCKKRDCHELGTPKLTLKLDMSHFVTVKL